MKPITASKSNYLITILFVSLIFLLSGRATHVSAQVSPHLEVHPQSDLVYALGWEDGVQLNMSVANPQGQQITNISVIVAQAPWDSSLPAGDFSKTSFDFLPGQILTVSGNGISLTYLIPNPKLTNIDVVADTISGTGTPGAQMLVCAHETGQDIYRWADIDSSGNWVVDFSSSGDPGDNSGSADLRPGSAGWADEIDAVGNQTWAEDWSVPNPIVSANPGADWVYGYGWPIGSELTLTTGQFSTTSITGPVSWDSNTFAAYFDLAGKVNLVPGDVVTVTDGNISKTLTISNFSVTGLSVITNSLSGTASPGGPIITCANTSPGGPIITCANTSPGGCRYATAGEDGSWAMPPDPAGFVLKPGMYGWAVEKESDGDETYANWQVPNSNIRMWLGNNQQVVAGYDWQVGDPVTLTIYSNVEETELLFGPTTKTVEPSSWDPNFPYVDFTIEGFQVMPGMQLVATNGLITKKHIVLPVKVTEGSSDADYFAGTTTPNTFIGVCVWNSIGCGGATSDSTGYWKADYSGSGVDITPGTGVNVDQYDEDGDGTSFSYGIPNPTMDAHLNENYLLGYGWSLGSTVTLSVEDLTTLKSPDFTTTAIVVTADLDPNQSYVRIDLGPNFLLEPGQVVTISDGMVTKGLTIMDLYSTSFNHAARTVYGHADPGAEVQVEIWSQTGETLTVQAAADGRWEAHSNQNNDPFYYNDDGIARSADSDGDTTSYRLKTGNIFATPENDWFELSSCLNYQTYDLAIDDPATGPGPDYQSSFTTTPIDPSAGCNYGAIPLGPYDLKAGDIVTVTSRHNVRTLVIPSRKVTRFNVIGDTVSGKAQPGDWAFAWISPGIWRETPVDPNGNWSLDFTSTLGPDPSQAVVDLLPGQQWAILQVDEDGDFTDYETVIPTPNIGSALGAGWFNSPVGAYSAKPASTEKAVFDFAAKYDKKISAWVGTAQFAFKGFVFTSTALDWLALDGTRLQLTGSGKVNGKGSYGFMIDAISGGTSKAALRIRIWDQASGAVVYDNMPGTPDNVLPDTTVKGGAIVISK